MISVVSEVAIGVAVVTAAIVVRVVGVGRVAPVTIVMCR